MPKASVKEGRAQESKVKEIRDVPVNGTVQTVLFDEYRPLIAIDNPDEVLPHDQVPETVRASIISIYGEAFFTSQQWTVGRIHKLKQAITHPRENLVRTLAMICSPKCPVKDQCPMDIIGRPPVGERCPRELQMAHMLIREYLLSISERLEVDPSELESDITAYNMIVGVVESDIETMRLNSTIAEEGYIQENETGFNTETGQVLVSHDESIAVRIKTRVEKRKNDLLKQLLATPEMEAKYRKREKNDVVARQAEVLEALAKKLGLDSQESVKQIAEDE
jgi:hypothetical protein